MWWCSITKLLKWFHTRLIFGSCEIILGTPCVCVLCGPWDYKIVIFTMVMQCWLYFWASSLRTKPIFFVCTIIIYNINDTKFGSVLSALSWFWLRLHCSTWWWHGVQNKETRAVFLHKITLQYYYWLIESKPRPYESYGLGLNPFCAMVAFWGPSIFEGLSIGWRSRRPLKSHLPRNLRRSTFIWSRWFHL